MLLMIHLEMWCAKPRWYFSKGGEGYKYNLYIR